MRVKRDIFTEITCELFSFNAWLEDQTGQTGLELAESEANYSPT